MIAEGTPKLKKNDDHDKCLGNHKNQHSILNSTFIFKYYCNKLSVCEVFQTEPKLYSLKQ